MIPVDTPPGGALSSSDEDRDEPIVRLRLYVARSTPNSVRAEANLSTVLEILKDQSAHLSLEVIDVFSQPKRAIIDGVIVTPTLVGLGVDKRVVLMGDLTDRGQLESVLRDLSCARAIFVPSDSGGSSR